MRNIRNKRGFALVECVIAIAVFTIMAMMIAMLVNMAIRTHQDNIRETRLLREQRDDFVEENLLDRGINGDLILEFNGVPNPVKYEFDDKKSPNSGGLEITKFDIDTGGLTPQAGEIFPPISLSSWVWESIVNQHNAGIVVSSPNMTALRTKAITDHWGGNICQTVGCGHTGSCTLTFRAGVAEVAKSELFAYRIPSSAVAAIPGSNAVWDGNGTSTANWEANRDAANRGAPPTMGIDLIANMVEVKFNGDVGSWKGGANKTGWIKPAGTENEPDRVIFRVEKDVVGVVFPGDLRDRIWLDTDPTSAINQNYLDGGVLKYYALVLEKKPEDKFPTFTFALITEKHIKDSPSIKPALSPTAGNLKLWLRLGEPCIFCGEYPCKKDTSLGCPP